MINGRESFRETTGRDQQREVAGLYAYAQLDPLIDLACLVAGDFFARPHLYTALGDAVPGTLARLRNRVGFDEFYPSPAQRRAMFEPVFGSGSANSDFGRLREGLLTASATFAEWSQATGIPMLRERVRTAHRPFREYLLGVYGASIKWSRNNALPRIADAESYNVLRDRGVVAVFGLTNTPTEDWPFREDANGDKVVEQISVQLEMAPMRRLTREGFSAIQRVALRGAEAIAAVLNFEEGQNDEELDKVISSCYTWNAALKAAYAPDMSVRVPGTN